MSSHTSRQAAQAHRRPKPCHGCNEALQYLQPDVPADGGREVGIELNGQRIMAPLGAVLDVARAEVQSTLQAAG